MTAGEQTAQWPGEDLAQGWPAAAAMDQGQCTGHLLPSAAASSSWDLGWAVQGLPCWLQGLSCKKQLGYGCPPNPRICTPTCPAPHPHLGISSRSNTATKKPPVSVLSGQARRQWWASGNVLRPRWGQAGSAGASLHRDEDDNPTPGKDWGE